jgi:hypothetical protein
LEAWNVLEQFESTSDETKPTLPKMIKLIIDARRAIQEMESSTSNSHQQHHSQKYVVSPSTSGFALGFPNSKSSKVVRLGFAPPAEKKNRVRSRSLGWSKPDSLIVNHSLELASIDASASSGVHEQGHREEDEYDDESDEDEVFEDVDDGTSHICDQHDDSHSHEDYVDYDHEEDAGDPHGLDNEDEEDDRHTVMEVDPENESESDDDSPPYTTTKPASSDSILVQSPTNIKLNKIGFPSSSLSSSSKFSPGFPLNFNLGGKSKKAQIHEPPRPASIGSSPLGRSRSFSISAFPTSSNKSSNHTSTKPILTKSTSATVSTTPQSKTSILLLDNQRSQSSYTSASRTISGTVNTNSSHPNESSEDNSNTKNNIANNAALFPDFTFMNISGQEWSQLFSFPILNDLGIIRTTAQNGLPANSDNPGIGEFVAEIQGLLTEPEVEPGKKPSLKVITEMNRVRQRRKILVSFTCYALLMRVCSFDMFLFLLLVTNIVLLYGMKNAKKLNVKVSLDSRSNHFLQYV